MRKKIKRCMMKLSLNEKLSDLVGSASFDVNNNLKLTYNFNIGSKLQQLKL